MTIQELIAELEQAKSPSFVLDERIQSALLPDRKGMMPPNYSASVDAAMRLAVNTFDDAAIDIEVAHRTVGGKSHGLVEICGPTIDVRAKAATPALALCLAICRGKLAQEVAA